MIERTSRPHVPLRPLRDRDPRTLGHYRLLGRLGSGGMGIAFLAEASGGWAVVKVIRSEIADDDSQRLRIRRELEAMTLASGPYTAALLEEHIEEDPSWFAMEFVPGPTLTRRVDELGAMSASDAALFAFRLKLALRSIHDSGVIHRDLKPSNVVLSPSGPVLLDFGVAGVTDSTSLTSTGVIVGSVGWLAPEQVRGDTISTATDIHAWALCVIFAATGKPPFGSGNSASAIYEVLERTPIVPASLPPLLRAELEAALAKDSNQRPDWGPVIPSGQDPAAWRDVAESRTATVPVREGSGLEPKPRKRSRGRYIAAAGVGATLVLLAAVASAAALGDAAPKGPEMEARSVDVADPIPTEAVTRRALSSSMPSSAGGQDGRQATANSIALSAPSKLRLREGREALKVSWQPVPGARAYRVVVSQGSGGQELVRLTLGTDVVIDNLRGGVEYRVSVAAVAGPQIGPSSPAVTGTPGSGASQAEPANGSPVDLSSPADQDSGNDGTNDFPDSTESSDGSSASEPSPEGPPFGGLPGDGSGGGQDEPDVVDVVPEPEPSEIVPVG